MQQSLDIDGYRSGEKSLDNLWLDEKTTTRLPRYDRYYPEVISVSLTTIYTHKLALMINYIWWRGKFFIGQCLENLYWEATHGKMQSATECNPFESKYPKSHHLY